MGDSALSADDRLPWLDAPRPPAKPIPAARRARTPLLVLLGLFFFSAIAVMAYLAGRSIPPVATPAPTTPIPAPTPQPAAPIAPPAPVVTTPTPPVAAPVRVEPAKPRATPRKATSRRSSARAVAVDRTTDRVRSLPIVYVAPRPPITWAARPFAGPRGRVIQLGTYRTQMHADAAWWRVARAYPYLATLPRVVTAVGPTPGRARYYQVRLAAGSRREARALCKYLHRIGRGCVIV